MQQLLGRIYWLIGICQDSVHIVVSQYVLHPVYTFIILLKIVPVQFFLFKFSEQGEKAQACNSIPFFILCIGKQQQQIHCKWLVYRCVIKVDGGDGGYSGRGEHGAISIYGVYNFFPFSIFYALSVGSFLHLETVHSIKWHFWTPHL